MYLQGKARATAKQEREEKKMRRIEVENIVIARIWMTEHEVVEATLYTDADSGKTVIEYFAK